MPRYKISVTRTVEHTATIEVEADCLADAFDAVESAEAPVIVELLEKAEWDLESENYETESGEEIVP